MTSKKQREAPVLERLDDLEDRVHLLFNMVEAYEELLTEQLGVTKAELRARVMDQIQPLQAQAQPQPQQQQQRGRLPPEFYPRVNGEYVY